MTSTPLLLLPPRRPHALLPLLLLPGLNATHPRPPPTPSSSQVFTLLLALIALFSASVSAERPRGKKHAVAHRKLTNHGEGWHEFVAHDCGGGFHLFPGAPFEMNFAGDFLHELVRFAWNEARRGNGWVDTTPALRVVCS